jgi:phosphonate transport system substrate-binding protein
MIGHLSRRRRTPTRLALALLFLVAHAAGGAAEEGAVRVGMIPDAGATQVSIEQKAPLRDHLAQAIGRSVELVIPTNYNATVEGLGNGSLDFAYLGGLTYVKARARYGVVPLVQRDSDRQFHALFITAATSAIGSLADLKGRSFAFGDINSTSGHLMPFAALKQAGLVPGSDFSFRYTGSHPATAKAVEAGTVDAGALDETVYRAMLAEGHLDPAKLRVFYTTPPFVDYVWVARDGLDSALREKFAQAFLALDAERDAKILAILRGNRFVGADDDEYESLRQIARELQLF